MMLGKTRMSFKGTLNRRHCAQQKYPSCIRIMIFVSIMASGIFGTPKLSTAQVVWIDDPITAGSTPIKATHINQLRTEINAKRATCNGLAPFTWTDDPLAGDMLPRSVYTIELRTAVDAIYSNPPLRSKSFGNFTNPTINPGNRIRSVHITQLRTAFDEASCCGDTVCDDSPGPEDCATCPDDCGGMWRG